MNNNVKPIVIELIATKAELEPLEAKYERAKEQIRAVGPDTYKIPGMGTVIVSAPVERKAKGSQITLDPEQLEKADPELKAELFALGIVSVETVYTRASKSKVEVKLETASDRFHSGSPHRALQTTARSGMTQLSWISCL